MGASNPRRFAKQAQVGLMALFFTSIVFLRLACVCTDERVRPKKEERVALGNATEPRSTLLRVRAPTFEQVLWLSRAEHRPHSTPSSTSRRWVTTLSRRRHCMAARLRCSTTSCHRWELRYEHRGVRQELVFLSDNCADFISFQSCCLLFIFYIVCRVWATARTHEHMNAASVRTLLSVASRHDGSACL